jgi:hypothetical protein
MVSTSSTQLPSKGLLSTHRGGKHGHVRLSLTIVLLALLGLRMAAQAIDISGTWNASVDLGTAQGTPVFSLEQKGETLAGTVTNPLGTQKVTGTVQSDKVLFGFEGSRGGEAFKVVYSGTIESATRMRGTVEFTGALDGAGTWVATKR